MVNYSQHGRYDDAVERGQVAQNDQVAIICLVKAS
jgi:hypothetical protein